MELFSNLLLGFSIALTPINILFCLFGTLIGTLIGVLPGIGPLATIAILLPITFNLEPVSALIMLAGIYYGAQYGGSTTAILINLPGESSSIVTCLDGHQMARQGRAGPALAIAAIGSFIAGSFATVVIAIAAVPLTAFAQKFGAPEYFSLMVLGLVGAVVLSSGSLFKSVLMIFVGLLFGLVGTDVNSGSPRLTFGIQELRDGIDFVPMALGVFGIAEIVLNLERGVISERTLVTSKISGLMPTRADFRAALPAILRGSMLGTVLGVLPGGGAVLASFASYTLEKKIAKDPSSFGHGAIEGLAAPESANNAGAQTSFIPMLTLGIPPNAVMALMIGAMTIHGITPGPQVLNHQPALFWGIIASMWIGNLMLVVINLPLVGIWVRLLNIPYRLLFPAIILFCCIGIYTISSSPFELWQTAFFGLLGYIFIKLGCEPVPLLLGLILGPIMEENFRRAMVLSRGDLTIFLDHPISAVLLAIAVALLVVVISPAVRSKRDEAFEES
jgi:putative tricarboxylic transport membrane protein